MRPTAKLPRKLYARFGRPSGALVCSDKLSQDSPFATLRVHHGLLSTAPPGPNNRPHDRVLQVALSLLLFVFIGISLNAQTPDKRPWGKYTGPHSLGIFSLDHDISIKSFLANFGLKPTGREIYCFSDSKNGFYLNVRISEHDSGSIEFLMLSSFPNCKHMHVTETTIDPTVWRTPEGISIGSAEQDVQKAYHTPIYDFKLTGLKVRSIIAGITDADKDPMHIGDYSYLYSCLMEDKKKSCDTLNASQMGFQNNKLIWINISDSE
jgi:hypothetical protein